MHSLDEDRHRAGAASNIEHSESGFDRCLFDQRSFRLVRAQQPQEGIVEWHQPALPECGNVTPLGLIRCFDLPHCSLPYLPAPRYPTGIVVSTTTPRVSSTRVARAFARDETTSLSRVPTK